MNSTILPLLGVAMVALALGLACSSDSTGPGQPVPSALRLDRTAVALPDGDTTRLQITVLDQNGQPFATVPAGLTINWSSSDDGVATVNAAGLVTAAHPGSARIEAAAGELRASATVTVTQVATLLEYVDGTDQEAAPATALPDSVVVRVSDRHGAGVPNIAVAFEITAGGGTASPAQANTNADGHARTAWTLGPGPGEQGLEARVEGLSGSPVAIRATALEIDGPIITGTSPDPLVEGGSATLTGTGFSADPSANAVTVDGVAATVTAASATSLTITVPTFDCRPARTVAVQVTAAGSSNAVQHPLRPAAFLELPVGEQLILSNPQDFCLQFDESSSAAEAYLIGVQSVSEAVTSLTPVTLTGAIGAAVAAAPKLAAPITTSGTHGTLRSTLDPRAVALWRRHREAEARLRAAELNFLEAATARIRPRADRLAPAGAPAPAALNVGDPVEIRVPEFGAGLCTAFTPITAVVRKIGERGIWLEDVANPEGGLTDDDFAMLSDYLDNDAYPTIVDYFGEPTDFDGNGRILIVATKEVNKVEGLNAFVSARDFLPRSECAASDEGEIYYSAVPDPAGEFGLEISRSWVLQTALPLIPHELTHIIQLGRRLTFPGATAFPTVWEAEGQATLAEEIMGHHLRGRSPGQNYGADVAFDGFFTDDDDVWWYSGFLHLVYYYGFETPDTRIANAPEQCSWLGGSGQGNDGPCLDPNLYYGVTWSLLRWISDHFGPGFPGGEKGFHQALIENTYSGFATIEDVVGLPMRTLLAQWAAMLYVDDRLPGAAARLTLPSWNLFDIESALVETARLQPRERPFGTFSDEITVRGGSTGYFRVSGAGRPATAIRARGLTDGPLPSIMQLWIVRLQ